ncbi:MAG TPA: hypothetical protein VFT47_17490, partial [Vicinamibacterales bacterium]|nr:hypothetical protein [Vicinamibacterales bacterium]
MDAYVAKIAPEARLEELPRVSAQWTAAGPRRYQERRLKGRGVYRGAAERTAPGWFGMSPRRHAH